MDASAPGDDPVERRRIDAIDLLRGLVMVVMALDHARDFFAPAGFAPENLERATAALFATRWVTHFCAPVFVFLAGTGAFLYASRGRSRAEVSRFLLTRGLWLVVLELVVVNASWLQFVYSGSFFLFVQVIWAIGWSMVCLALVIWLPRSLVLAFGAVLVLFHNFLDEIPADQSLWGHVWGVFHAQHWIPIDDWGVYVVYPLVPWLGVMALGWCFGGVALLTPERRRTLCFAIGGVASVAFVALRLGNGYGDPQPWAVQEAGPVMTLASFLNTTKYPPSLSFLLMTLGPAIAALPLLEVWRGRLASALVTFGRVPLFYYLVHIPLLHLLAAGYTALRWDGAIGFWSRRAAHWPEGYELSLPVAYAAWAITIALLYPACRWFAGVKRRRPGGWLSYL